jgi:hypothetical protein
MAIQNFGELPLRKPRRMCEYNVGIDLSEIAYGD